MKKANTNSILKATDLVIGYTTKKNRTIVCSGINFEVQQGHLIGVVGVNGIGKSTLLRTLTNVQPLLSGTIMLNGTNIKELTALDVAKQVSIVLTDPVSSKHLSVYDLIALGRHPYTNWIGSLTQKDKMKIENAIDLVAIKHLKHKTCDELSDGQLQNVMIARALAQDTDIIILDEPTAHLDIYHKVYVLKLLETLTKETGKTILFSSHDIDLAIQLCNTMLVMQGGSIISNTPCHLIEQGVFDALFPKDMITFDNTTGRFNVVK